MCAGRGAPVRCRRCSSRGATGVRALGGERGQGGEQFDRAGEGRAAQRVDVAAALGGDGDQPLLAQRGEVVADQGLAHPAEVGELADRAGTLDRKSTRLNSSHANISYAVFCLKKKNKMY